VAYFGGVEHVLAVWTLERRFLCENVRLLQRSYRRP